jgi:hypothetical protein
MAEVKLLGAYLDGSQPCQGFISKLHLDEIQM